tara:strand:+ start:356 stop:1252 length:897 start_codon:yes stop_codon:yes gene_type:complete
MNNYYSIIAPAKLNLNLFIKGKTKNGLHLLESDICFLELADKIFFKFNQKDIFLQKFKNESLQIDVENNLILQSLNAFRNLTGWNKKFEISLDKYIPIGAGLGGGSADAAATLILLRKLYNMEGNSRQISISDLYEIANKLGSDIPACLESKDLKLSGYGNKIRRQKVSNNYYYLLVNPKIKLSTKKVFTQFNFQSEQKLINKKSLLDNITIYNSLLEPAIYLAPQIKSILTILKNIPNIVTYGMSGSGSTCFGIFNDIKNIINIHKYFKDDYFIWFGKKRVYSVNRVRYSKTLENKF